MAGAMRKMGIYLGLVEDDERAGYDRYASRQGGYDEDPGYGRYHAEGGYDDYERDYPEADHFDEPVHAEDPLPEREPALPRRSPATVRPLNLAASPVGPGARPGGHVGGAMAGGRSSGGGMAGSGLAGGAMAGGAMAGSAMAGGGTAGSGPAGGGHTGSSAAGHAGSAGLAVQAVQERPAGPSAAAPVIAAVPEPAPVAAQPYRITTLHPRTYNEARTIGERFREGLPVIMNLTEMDDADAKRLVDFAAGLSFGLRGSIERVTAKVFLISPQNIDVTAEDKARIREGGFFNQS